MKFYSNVPAEIFWDNSERKALCAFSDGIYETDNPREIEILKQYYRFEEEVIVDESIKNDAISRVRERKINISKKGN